MHTINPCGCRSLSENLPPCASTMVRAIERPRPKPAASSIFRASSPRTNGSSITSLRASEMPGPSSSTSIVKLSDEALRRIGYRSSSSDRGAAGRRRRAPWPPRWTARCRHGVIDRQYERRIEHQFGYRHSPAVPAIAEGFAVVLVVLILRRERHSRHRQRRRGISLGSSDRLQDLTISDQPATMAALEPDLG